MVSEIMGQLVSAARVGEGALLDEVQKIDPSHLKFLVASLVLTTAHFHIQTTEPDQWQHAEKMV